MELTDKALASLGIHPEDHSKANNPEELKKLLLDPEVEFDRLCDFLATLSEPGNESLQEIYILAVVDHLEKGKFGTVAEFLRLSEAQKNDERIVLATIEGFPKFFANPKFSSWNRESLEEIYKWHPDRFKPLVLEGVATLFSNKKTSEALGILSSKIIDVSPEQKTALIKKALIARIKEGDFINASALLYRIATLPDFPEVNDEVFHDKEVEGLIVDEYVRLLKESPHDVKNFKHEYCISDVALAPRKTEIVGLVDEHILNNLKRGELDESFLRDNNVDVAQIASRPEFETAAIEGLKHIFADGYTGGSIVPRVLQFTEIFKRAKDVIFDKTNPEYKTFRIIISQCLERIIGYGSDMHTLIGDRQDIKERFEEDLKISPDVVSSSARKAIKIKTGADQKFLEKFIEVYKLSPKDLPAKLK